MITEGILILRCILNIQVAIQNMLLGEFGIQNLEKCEFICHLETLDMMRASGIKVAQEVQGPSLGMGRWCSCLEVSLSFLEKKPTKKTGKEP